MVSPSIWALTPGTSLRAWTTALTKKDMKPSFTPFFLTKSSWYLARRAMTPDMSTSLKVVSMAASCWAATRRWAILARSGVILRRVWRVPGAGAGATTGAAGRAATGAATGAGRAGVGFSAAASISPFVTRPALPVPTTVAGSMPVSAARRRTAGEASVVLAAAAAGAPASGLATEEAVAAESMVATIWPIFTSSPAATWRAIRPADSAVPSLVILSVSSSKRGWSFLTTSPSLTCHLARMPEAMDSPMGGILTSRRDMVEAGERETESERESEAEAAIRG